MSEWHMVWPLWKFPVTGKRKAVLEEPSIPLCADDDWGLEIEGIDLLSWNAPSPGSNLTVCKCAHTIFPLVLTKLVIFYSQYHMTCKGKSYLNLRWVGFVMTSAKKLLAFILESIESTNTGVEQWNLYMSINSISAISELPYLVIRGGEEG